MIFIKKKEEGNGRTVMWRLLGKSNDNK